MAIKNKRYYWLQLKKDFFYSKEMKLLRRIPGGDTYTVIYLKMMLASLEEEGKIYIDGVLDNPYEEIALEIDEDKDAVEITINFLLSKNLITISQTEAKMEQVPELVGSETASTRRSRKHREQKALQCNTGATNGNGEKEIEKDIEKEIEVEGDIEKTLAPPPPPKKSMDFSQFVKTSGLRVNQNHVQRLLEYIGIDNMDLDLVKLAITKTVDQGIEAPKYTFSILDNWKSKGITTVEQALKEQEEFEARKSSKKKNSYIDEDEARRMQEKYGF